MTITMTFERETKNTVRFAEDEHSGENAIGTLYLQKGTHQELGQPKRIKVEITATK